MKLNIESIKRLVYSKQPKIDAVTERKSYPKDIRWDDEVPGFGVRVFPSAEKGSFQGKTYVFQYRTHKQAREYRGKNGERLTVSMQRLLSLGKANKITLDKARTEAHKHNGRVNDGGNPAEERKKDRHGRLMSDLCEQYRREYASQWSKAHQDEIRRRIKLQILPALGSKQVQHITASDVRELRHQIGVIEKHEVLANCVRRQLSTMFDRAKEWGYVNTEFMNPAKGIKDFKEKSREAYVKPEHMAILARAIEDEENESAKLAIWMYIFTGKRKMEILSAEWKNIDEAARTLYIPNTKNDEPEQLPLNDEALSIIERAKAIRKLGHPYIFPGLKPNEHLVNIRKPWERIKKMAVAEGAESVRDVVIHGLRHTAAVWLVNHTDADTALVGKVLNHKSSLATRQYAKYKIRTKERALQNLGSMVTAASKAVPGKVVQLGQRATDQPTTGEQSIAKPAPAS